MNTKQGILLVCIALLIFCAYVGVVSASGPTYVSGVISSNTIWTAADE